MAIRLRFAWSALLLAVVLLTGCTAVYHPTAETHPPGAALQIQAGRIWGEDGFVWTELNLINHGSESIEVKPAAFRVLDESGRDVDFKAWAGFGGSRFTRSTPRPLRPGRDMNGIIRWYPIRGYQPFTLLVDLGGEAHRFRFEVPR